MAWDRQSGFLWRRIVRFSGEKAFIENGTVFYAEAVCLSLTIDWEMTAFPRDRQSNRKVCAPVNGDNASGSLYVIGFVFPGTATIAYDLYFTGGVTEL